MANLVNRFVVFIICMGFLMIHHYERIYVVFGLGCMIVELFEIYRMKKKIFQFDFIIFCGLLFFFPQLSFFMPLRMYSLISWKLYHWIIFDGLIFFVLPNFQSLELFFLSLLSMLLAFYTQKQLELDQHFLRFRDTRKEQETKLLQRNKALLEKQDYEIYVATLHERNRIAREIHDHVGHQLSSSILQVAALQTIEKDEHMKVHLAELKQTLDQAMNDIRSSVHDLHDEAVDLQASIEALLKNFTFCNWNFDYEVHSALHRKIKYSLIAIVKEALSNISRHSNATALSIRIVEHPAFLQVQIDDNGTIKTSHHEEGMGLSNMIERIEQLHGQIQIHDREGFHIYITIQKEVEECE